MEPMWRSLSTARMRAVAVFSAGAGEGAESLVLGLASGEGVGADVDVEDCESANVNAEETDSAACAVDAVADNDVASAAVVDKAWNQWTAWSFILLTNGSDESLVFRLTSRAVGWQLWQPSRNRFNEFD